MNYYGKFVPNIHDLRYPLDQLLWKDVKWDWSADCQRSCEKIKQVLKSGIVAADASKTGIGAEIYHNFPKGSMKSIQHASRSLAHAEQA